ncbi:hypothetical protein K1719_014261 [Acacia pycnantha]|nr:hypothetical protein K1719_014261 [Acacia pycnantha]
MAFQSVSCGIPAPVFSHPAMIPRVLSDLDSATSRLNIYAPFIGFLLGSVRIENLAYNICPYVQTTPCCDDAVSANTNCVCRRCPPGFDVQIQSSNEFNNNGLRVPYFWNCCL